MAHPFPAEFVAGLDDLRIVLADLGIEGNGALDAVLLEYLHHPPDPHPDAEVAPRVVQHVGLHVHGHRRDRGCRLVEMEMLDVGDHPDRNPLAIWKTQRLAVDDR